jgi:thioredoxin reductase (NADPH)
MPNIHKTEVLIIGSGPAGLTAAIYAARANLNPILIAGNDSGGQLTITTDVENYPGFADTIQGPWLIEQMTKQAENVGVKIISDHIREVDFAGQTFHLIGESDDVYESRSVIIATGARAKWLGLDSEKKFQGFGVSGCATCDGFFFKNRDVIVIGGGNTAVEEALYLTNHAKKIYLVHRKNSLKAEKILQNRLFKNAKIEIIWNHELEEVLGSENPKSVTGARLRDIIDGSEKEVKVDGIFIAIGHKPNSDLFVRTGINIDSDGYIITEGNTTRTNIAGVFAAGDIQDKVYRQAVTSAGSGCIAALEAEKFLSNAKPNPTHRFLTS